MARRIQQIRSRLAHIVQSQSSPVRHCPSLRRRAGESEIGTNTSLLPLAILIALLGVLVLIGTSFRRYEGTMRMVSTNSLAISAACHAHPRDRRDGYSLPVRWAVVKSSSGYGHCAFTTAPADQTRLPKVSSGPSPHILYGARDWPAEERTRFFQAE